MRNIIDPSKQKFIVVAAASLVSLFGFEAASQALRYYQVPSFLDISFFVYFFLVFWQSFVFDLHLKPAASIKKLEKSLASAVAERFAYLKVGKHWLHFQNYLILPGIIYWSTIGMLYLNAFEVGFKQVVIILSTLALTAAFWYLKTVFYGHAEASRSTRHMIFMAKFYASYLAIAASLGLARYFDYSGNNIYWFVVTVFAVTFLLLYQALFQHHFVGFKMLKFLLLTGIFLAIAGYVIYLLWNINYFSGALLLAAIYNTIWGIIHHRFLDKNLSREIVYEYLAVLFIVMVIIIGSTNFAERI